MLLRNGESPACDDGREFDSADFDLDTPDRCRPLRLLGCPAEPRSKTRPNLVLDTPSQILFDSRFPLETQ
eukprot:COSAG01_NODE_25794_length_733_cov_0.563091_1_plen_69_part_10